MTAVIALAIVGLLAVWIVVATALALLLGRAMHDADLRSAAQQQIVPLHGRRWS
jgi:hypothetical protein